MRSSFDSPVHTRRSVLLGGAMAGAAVAIGCEPARSATSGSAGALVPQPVIPALLSAMRAWPIVALGEYHDVPDFHDVLQALLRHPDLVVSVLVAQAHAAGRLHPNIRASDFAVIPLFINPVVAASEGATPDLWRRWLAIVLEGIARGPRAKAFPGNAPDVDHVEEIIAKECSPRPRRQ